jgi:hypothetical protein
MKNIIIILFLAVTLWGQTPKSMVIGKWKRTEYDSYNKRTIIDVLILTQDGFIDSVQHYKSKTNNYINAINKGTYRVSKDTIYFHDTLCISKDGKKEESPQQEEDCFIIKISKSKMILEEPTGINTYKRMP